MTSQRIQRRIEHLLDAAGCARITWEAAAEIRHRPKVVLTRLQLAELLLEHGHEEGARAQQHLDFAVAELREMKMQPSLEGRRGTGTS